MVRLPVPPSPRPFAARPFRTASVLLMGLDLAAVVLLVLPASNAWFRALNRAPVAAALAARKRKKRRS